MSVKSIMGSWVLIISILCPLRADIIRAYSFYLLEEYDSALVYYDKAIMEDPLSVDPYFGKMNSLSALGRYSTAIEVGELLLSGNESVELLHKMLYLYAISNRSEKVNELFEKLLKVPEIQKDHGKTDLLAEVMLSMGYGYLRGGNRRLAREWFFRNSEMFPEYESIRYAIEEMNATALTSSYVVNAAAGAIAYFDSDFYDKGMLYNISPSVTFNQKHNYSLRIDYTNIQLNENIVYYYFQQLYTDFNFIPEHERKGVETVVEYAGSGMYDTLYITNVPTDPQNYKGTAPLHKSTYSPDDLWEYQVLAQYTLLHSSVPNTRLLLGARYSRSNMLYTNNTYSVIAGHFTNQHNLSAGAYYYYTKTDSIGLMQVSPEFKTVFSRFNFALQTNAVVCFMSKFTEARKVDPFQLSFDGTLAYTGGKGSVSLTGQSGKRVFAVESGGAFFRTTTSEFNYGITFVGQWYPFTAPVTLYFLVAFADYENYNSLVNMGGLHLQW